MGKKTAPILDTRERARVTGDYYVSDVFEFQTYSADGALLQQVRNLRKQGFAG